MRRKVKFSKSVIKRHGSIADSTWGSNGSSVGGVGPGVWLGWGAPQESDSSRNRRTRKDNCKPSLILLQLIRMSDNAIRIITIVYCNWVFTRWQ
jgi:hypothetical protein